MSTDSCLVKLVFFLLWGLFVDLSVLLVGKEIHREWGQTVVIYLFRLVLARGAQMDEPVSEVRLLTLDEIANNLENRSNLWYEDLPQSDITDSCFKILPLSSFWMSTDFCLVKLVFFCFLLWRLFVDLSVLLVSKEIHRRWDESVVIDLFRLVLAWGAQMDEQFLKCAC